MDYLRPCLIFPAFSRIKLFGRRLCKDPTNAWSLKRVHALKGGFPDFRYRLTRDSSGWGPPANKGPLFHVIIFLCFCRIFSKAPGIIQLSVCFPPGSFVLAAALYRRREHALFSLFARRKNGILIHYSGRKRWKNWAMLKVCSCFWPSIFFLLIILCVFKDWGVIWVTRIIWTTNWWQLNL